MPMMNVQHDQWPEFIDRLGGPEGCNFTEDMTWTCAGGHDKSLARKILEKMGLTPSEIDASCAYFESRGGYCDCEIVFNVAKD